MPETGPPSSVSTVEFVVATDADGQRLDHAVAARESSFSRSRIQKLIKEGLVTVDDTPVTRVAERVSTGQRVALTIPEPEPTTLIAQPLTLDILFEDADIIVVNKPAGMVVHPAAGHADGTLVNALLHHVTDLSGIGGELRPGIVHRLDKGTSGVLVVAKHDRAHASLSEQFRNRTVQKEYVALVWGALDAGRRIESAIGRDPVQRQRMSVRAHRSRQASTSVLSARALQSLTLVRVAILTGRTHQIRVHLQAIGHPVVGDGVYGGVRRQLPLHLRILGTLSRPFLHAARLAFLHPSDRRAVEFEAPLPADLVAVLDALRD